MKKNAGKMINLEMQVMVIYRSFSGKHRVWKLVTEEGARRCGKCSVIG